MNTFCNPLDLSYCFQNKGVGDISCREAADPSLVLFEGNYCLFASKSCGYWWSPDLQEWIFVKSKILPVDDYAPDVRVINGYIYFTASGYGRDNPVFRSKNPVEDEWELVAEAFPYWDPNMFQDEDGRVYMYWGCSDKDPICGVEVDIETMKPIGEPTALFGQNHDRFGWERKSEDNRKSVAPHIEGPWMTKHKGRYYLQYAGPGTEFNIYADGVYEGDSPLGPFTFSENNPLSFKPGGFMNGAGHGSTFHDNFGNLWHISTMSISIRHMFERRLGLWPAGFDADGVMYCNTRFGDYPTQVPTGPWTDPQKDPGPQWMLLSYQKPSTCSSHRRGHPPTLLCDENCHTYWAADRNDPEPWVMIDLADTPDVHAVQINFTEDQCDQFGYSDSLRHQYVLELSDDGRNWSTLIDRTESANDAPHAYHEFPARNGKYLRLRILHMPAKGTPAVSGLRVFGVGSGTKPASSHITRAELHEQDPLSATITWQQVTDADGYNIRWGMAPDKLYHDWLVYGAHSLELGALHAGQPAWVAVEAFNAHGISELSDPVRIA